MAKTNDHVNRQKALIAECELCYEEAVNHGYKKDLHGTFELTHYDIKAIEDVIGDLSDIDYQIIRRWSRSI